MNSLFIRLYLDEDVDVVVAALLQNYFANNRKHYGVILAVRHSPQTIAQRLSAILDQTTADEMVNQVRYI